MALDYDRGVRIRIHPHTGARIGSYVDEPGVYRNAFGSEVDPVLAQEAGFDVEKETKEKLKRERLTAAQRQIEEEFDAVGERKVIEQRNGFQVVTRGPEKFDVVDPDGNVLNAARALTLQEARRLIDKIAGPKVAVDDKEKD